MLKRRLYLQIYFIIISSLVAVVVVSAVMWSVFGRDDHNRDVLNVASRFVGMALPPAGSDPDRQRDVINQLGQDLNVEISLFAPDRSLIATTGSEVLPPIINRKSGWHRGPGGPGWVLKLPDERWLVIDLGRGDRQHPFFSVIFFIGSIALAVGLVALPFVRRLTRRLERLQEGVERIGAGHLTARVKVEGRDEISQLATSFNSAAEKIETLVESHKLLLANASHELRTPLSRIRLGVELLLQGDGAPDRREALKQDIDELDSLIDEILLMSRLDADTGAERFEEVDLLALVAEECARYENCELDGTAVQILGEPFLLRRLTRNLLDNAHKHGEPPILVSLNKEAQKVELIVRDHGSGFAPADIEKVFRPFYRAAEKQNISGYGLGLPLVKQIAEAHGGGADILSPGEGLAGVKVVLAIGPSRLH